MIKKFIPIALTRGHGMALKEALSKSHPLVRLISLRCVRILITFISEIVNVYPALTYRIDIGSLHFREPGPGGP